MNDSGQAPRIADGAGLTRETLSIDYVVCDVFTEHGLAGNQLAVFPHAEALGDGLRGALAREMNYSESVFVSPGVDGADARLSIFTPACELPFAGHPVLGAAAVLAQSSSRRLLLGTQVGPVTLTVCPAGPRRAEAWMQQPWPARVDVEAELIQGALGSADPDGPPAITGYDNGARYALVELRSRAAVAALEPDLASLGRLGHGALFFAGAGLSWKARMFAPSIGIVEDPATGSAAGPLAVHLHDDGRLAAGETMEIEQGVELGRPSRLRATVQSDADDGLRVSVGGHVVTVARGTFSLSADDAARYAERA